MATTTPPPRQLIIAVSANDHAFLMAEALGVGCDAFIEKPFTISKFESAMRVYTNVMSTAQEEEEEEEEDEVEEVGEARKGKEEDAFVGGGGG